MATVLVPGAPVGPLTIAPGEVIHYEFEVPIGNMFTVQLSSTYAPDDPVSYPYDSARLFLRNGQEVSEPAPWTDSIHAISIYDSGRDTISHVVSDGEEGGGSETWFAGVTVLGSDTVGAEDIYITLTIVPTPFFEYNLAALTGAGTQYNVQYDDKTWIMTAAGSYGYPSTSFTSFSDISYYVDYFEATAVWNMVLSPEADMWFVIKSNGNIVYSYQVYDYGTDSSFETPFNINVALGVDEFGGQQTSMYFAPDPNDEHAGVYGYDDFGYLRLTPPSSIVETGPLVVNGDLAEVVQDNSVTVNPLANDTIDGNPVSLAQLSGLPVVAVQPENGTVVVNGDGTFTVTPNPGFVGDITFEYAVQKAPIASEPPMPVIHGFYGEGSYTPDPSCMENMPSWFQWGTTPHFLCEGNQLAVYWGEDGSNDGLESYRHNLSPSNSPFLIAENYGSPAVAAEFRALTSIEFRNSLGDSTSPLIVGPPDWISGPLLLAGNGWSCTIPDEGGYFGEPTSISGVLDVTMDSGWSYEGTMTHAGTVYKMRYSLVAAE